MTVWSWLLFGVAGGGVVEMMSDIHYLGKQRPAASSAAVIASTLINAAVVVIIVLAAWKLR
jgi:hypothetical protein